MTPADTAKQEAARQAVALAFGLAGCLLLIMIQRKMGGGLVAMLEAQERESDPLGFRQRKIETAQRAADRWDRATVWLWRFGPWGAARLAYGRAEAARRRIAEEMP